MRVGDKIDGDKEMQSLALFDTGIDGIGVVKLSDVADVFIADDSDEVFTKINGNSGVVFSFSKQSDAATATVSENIAKKLNSLTQENEGLHFTTLMGPGRLHRYYYKQRFTESSYGCCTCNYNSVSFLKRY